MVNDDGGCVLLVLFLRGFGGVRLEVKDVESGDLVAERRMMARMMGLYV